MACDGKAVLKLFVAALCVACLALKGWTTIEGYRLGLLLQKQSREWDHNSFSTVGTSANFLMDITFGAYTIITIALLLGHISGDPKTNAETLLLVVGCVLMLAIGALLATWIDDVPHELVDNTIALTVLSVVTGIFLLTDAGTKALKVHRRSFRRAEKPKKAAKKVEIEEVGPAPGTRVEAAKGEAEKRATEATTESGEKPAKETQTDGRKNGIKSVEIRIKDGVQGKQTASTVDVLSQAEILDEMLQEESSRTGIRSGVVRQVPSFKASPLRHTSSYYVHGGVPTPFAWHRLRDQS